MSAAEVRIPADVTRVRLEDHWEVKFWSEKLRVSPDDLAATVREVGPRVEDVEAALHKAARTAFRNGGED